MKIQLKIRKEDVRITREMANTACKVADIVKVILGSLSEVLAKARFFNKEIHCKRNLSNFWLVRILSDFAN